MSEISKEDEVKVLRAIISYMFRKNGINLDNNFRHAVAHVADETKVAKEKVLSLSQSLVSEHMDFLLSPKNQGGH